VPRPELATKLGTPDVCTGCHGDRTSAWAADVIAHRPGVHRLGTPHYGEAIWRGRHGAADATRALVDLAEDADAPGLARATAVELLRGEPAPFALEAIRRAADATDPLVRLGAMPPSRTAIRAKSSRLGPRAWQTRCAPSTQTSTM